MRLRYAAWGSPGNVRGCVLLTQAASLLSCHTFHLRIMVIKGSCTANYSLACTRSLRSRRPRMYSHDWSAISQCGHLGFSELRLNEFRTAIFDQSRLPEHPSHGGVYWKLPGWRHALPLPQHWPCNHLKSPCMLHHDACSYRNRRSSGICAYAHGNRARGCKPLAPHQRPCLWMNSRTGKVGPGCLSLMVSHIPRQKVSNSFSMRFYKRCCMSCRALSPLLFLLSTVTPCKP